MSTKLRFIVVDDSQSALAVYSQLLHQAGHEVLLLSSSQDALREIKNFKPDCVLCDLMLPGMDGLELFKHMKADPEIKPPTFIIVSGKQFEYDKRNALLLGVDAYLTKPINHATFVKEVENIIEGRMVIKIWGCRGTLPVPGERSIKYGGNTNCITLTIANKQNFIFDAGTGIKELSTYLVKENKFPYSAKIFISHPHYDHINGIPFFVPLYMKGNSFEFLGADQTNMTLEETLAKQMDSVYFPVTMGEFSSVVTFRSLVEESFMIGDVKVDTLLLNHPGRCLGYRIEHKERVFCYITDNELYLKTDKEHYNEEEIERLIRFVHEADVLVIDTTYTDEEYLRKVGWGHSALTSVVEMADKAKVKLLCMHHHDPDQSDADIDKKLALAQAILEAKKSKTRVMIPREGQEIVVHKLS